MNNRKAVCVFQDSKIKGSVLFVENKETKYTEIHVSLSNVTYGEHGFHIHEAGDLREGCKSLCSHYNPHNKKHGGPEDKERHLGDLGNINAGKNGVVEMVIYDKKIKLSGKYSVIGRSVIIHEKRDDLGKGGNKESLITGNAGKRTACGVIGIVK